jgi:hypothetical protein
VEAWYSTFSQGFDGKNHRNWTIMASCFHISLFIRIHLADSGCLALWFPIAHVGLPLCTMDTWSARVHFLRTCIKAFPPGVKIRYYGYPTNTRSATASVFYNSGHHTSEIIHVTNHLKVYTKIWARLVPSYERTQNVNNSMKMTMFWRQWSGA